MSSTLLSSLLCLTFGATFDLQAEDQLHDLLSGKARIESESGLSPLRGEDLFAIDTRGPAEATPGLELGFDHKTITIRAYELVVKDLV